MGRLLVHLWTHGARPIEYWSLVLCRDVYHCTPVDLAAVPMNQVIDTITCLNAEIEVANRRANG
jgi:hypothetical protein